MVTTLSKSKNDTEQKNMRDCGIDMPRESSGFRGVGDCLLSPQL